MCLTQAYVGHSNPVLQVGTEVICQTSDHSPMSSGSQPEELDWNDPRKLASSTHKTFERCHTFEYTPIRIFLCVLLT